MARINSSLPDEAKKITGDALQGALVDLIDLSLLAKQAHWNVVGRNFRSVHLQLDEVVTMARLYTDQVAERATAIGVNPDGSATTVAATSALPQLAPDWTQDRSVVEHFVVTYAGVIERFRARVEATADADAVTQDLLIGITAELEQMSWMFQAEVQ